MFIHLPMRAAVMMWCGVIFTVLMGCTIDPTLLTVVVPTPAPPAEVITDNQTNADDGAPLCRFGLNVSSFPEDPFYIDDFDVAPLRVGWYIDYRALPSPPANNGAEYAMVIDVFDDDAGNYGYSPTGAELAATVAAHPGGIYIIGNEPDRRFYQHDVVAENYAYIYHDVYEEIKALDPTAQLWAGAITQPTPIRLAYLDRVLAAYAARNQTPMPVDGWAIHGFVLNERSCAAHNDDINVCWGVEIPPGMDETEGEVLTVEDTARIDLFAARIVSFRTWMADRGYRDVPLYVSEYGQLMPADLGFPPDAVSEYMNQTFDYMLTAQDDALGYAADDNRLVQRFAWFSTFDPNFNGYLYQSTTPDDPMRRPFVLSSMGENYRDYVAEVAESSDLALLNLAVDEVAGDLVVTVANSGNRMHATRAVLRLSVGGALASAQQIGSDVPIAVAGCGATLRVVIPWDDVATGEPPAGRLWVVIAEADFPDANPSNDVASYEMRD